MGSVSAPPASGGAEASSPTCDPRAYDPPTYYRPREPVVEQSGRQRADVSFSDDGPTIDLPRVPGGPDAGGGASRAHFTRAYEGAPSNLAPSNLAPPDRVHSDRRDLAAFYRPHGYVGAAPSDARQTFLGDPQHDTRPLGSDLRDVDPRPGVVDPRPVGSEAGDARSAEPGDPTVSLPTGPRVRSASAPGAATITVTRAVAARGGQAAQTVTRRLVAASRANGASESGLTPLIWNQVLSFGADAMITVALAGTVFFSAAQSDQKGNVLAYLLVTMAPFAVVAPVIGPVLDRFQHGRRWAMAASGFGRALLAVLMAQNFHNLLLLFPLALGSLVLSKAYSVVRAAAAPRVVPPDMTLVTANARLSIFGLGAALVGGGFVAMVVRATGSYPLGLWMAAIAFCVTGVFSLRLPGQVDSAVAARVHPEEPRRPGEQQQVPTRKRIRGWVSRGFGQQVITSVQGESALRWTAGFLTMFLAFYIEKTSHGVQAASSLGAVGAAVAVGNLIGTGSGARFSFRRPHVIVACCTAINAVACVLTAVSFNLGTAVAAMAICSATNSLGKLSLDAVIQRDVAETLRSSAFARSETFLQLAWVVGAAVALLLPADRGTLGMSVAGAFLAVSVSYIAVRAWMGVRAGRKARLGDR